MTVGVIREISKMFTATKSLIPALAIVLLLYACQNKNTNEEKINLQLIQSFNESNTLVMRSTTMQLKALEELSIDPAKTERATPWFEKAVLIDEYTNSLYRFIDSTARKITPDKGIEALNKKLADYKTSIFQTDVEIAETFSNHFSFINSFFYLYGWDTISNKPLKNSGMSKKEIVLLLEALKNRAINMENKLVSFCFQKVPSYNDGFESYSFIVNQNAQSFSPGAFLEIKASVGAISRAAKTVILVGKKNIPLNEEGFARFRNKVPDKPGTYKIPESASFYNLTTGKQEMAKVNIDYRVVKPCD